MDLSGLNAGVPIPRGAGRRRGPKIIDVDAEAGGSNALMLPARRKRAKAPAAAAPVLAPSAPPAPGRGGPSSRASAAAPATRQERRKSKSHMKKLAKLAEAKRKRDKRATVLQGLRDSAMPEAQMQLLRRSGALGQRDTVKQRLQRAVRSERMGLAISEEDASLLLVDSVRRDASEMPRQEAEPVRPFAMRAPAAAPAVATEVAVAEVAPAPKAPVPAAPVAAADGSFSFSVGLPSSWSAGADASGDWAGAAATVAPAPRATTDGSGQPLIPNNRAVKGSAGLSDQSAALDALAEARRRNSDLRSRGEAAAAPRAELGALLVDPSRIKAALVDGPKRHTMSMADAIRADVYERGSSSGGAASVQRMLEASLGERVVEERYLEEEEEEGSDDESDEEEETDVESGSDDESEEGAEAEEEEEGEEDDATGEEDGDASSSDDDGEEEEAAPSRWAHGHELPGGVDAVTLPSATAVAMQGTDAAAATVAGGLSSSAAMAGVRRAAPLKRRRGMVEVHRRPDIAEARGKLPVCRMEQEVMEAIGRHSTLILCGETGSGKTTQVPQFLYEAGYGAPAADGGMPGLVAVTQPRRVAAVTTAARVADELNVACGSRQPVIAIVRYEAARAGPRTRLAFMTDGVLLREAQEDLLLRRFSAVVLDEAHERNLNTDVLIGLLSRALPLRNSIAAKHDAAAAEHQARRGTPPPDDAPLFRGPHGHGRVRPLKLIIMSATLRVQDFTANKALFRTPPPVVNVPARQYPVTTHFARRTELVNYVDAAVKKVAQIHEKLPEGGVLVFLTGKGEIDEALAKLKAKFAAARKRAQAHRRGEEEERAARARAGADTEADRAAAAAPPADYPRTLVLPLYAALPREEQLRAFAPPPPGHRLVILATNVAETSITIPGIR